MSHRSSTTPWATALLAAVVTTAATWLLTCPTEAQTFRTAGEVLFLREIGAGIEPAGDGLAIGMVMPPEARPEAYRDVDVAEGDVVMVVNGQRVRDLAKARELYDATAVGAELTLGVMRNGQSHVVRFAKADPESLPKQMSFESSQGHGGMVQRQMVFQSGDGDAAPVPAAGVGVLLRDEDDAVKVVLVLPNAKTPLEQNDRIVSLGGQKATSAQAVADAIEAMEIGAKVDLDVERDGKTLQLSTAKVQSRATFIMRKDG